jgi:hypothetical protein
LPPLFKFFAMFMPQFFKLRFFQSHPETHSRPLSLVLTHLPQLAVDNR